MVTPRSASLRWQVRRQVGQRRGSQVRRARASIGPLTPLTFLLLSILRTQLGLSFINLAFVTQYPSTRRDALASLRSSVQVKPKVASRVIRDSLKAWLLQREAKSATTTEEVLSVDARAKQILQILTSAVSFPAETPDQIKDDALADIIILSHHAELGELLILPLKP